MAVRYTQKEKAAVRLALQNANKAGDIEAVIDNVCQAFAEARDGETKYCIVAVFEERPLVFGPYASHKTALNQYKKKGLPLGQFVGIVGMRPMP